MFNLLAAFFGRFIPKIVYRVLLAMGITTVAFVGGETLLEGGRAFLSTQIQGVGADLLGLIGMSGIDRYITIILSAHVAVFSVRALSRIFRLT